MTRIPVVLRGAFQCPTFTRSHPMNRKCVFALLPLAAIGLIWVSIATGGDTKGFKPLFNGKDLTGWKTFLKDDKADPAKTFVVKDGEIQVSGEPFGFFYTDKPYKNYVIRYSWT